MNKILIPTILGVIFSIFIFIIGISAWWKNQTKFGFIKSVLLLYSGLFFFITCLVFFNTPKSVSCELVAIHDNIKVFTTKQDKLFTWEDDREYDIDTLYIAMVDWKDEVLSVWELAGDEIDNSVG